MRRARYDRTPRAFKLPNAKKLSRHLSTASSHGGIGQNKKQNLRISHAPAAHVFSVWHSGTITATNSDWKAMRVKRLLTRNASIFDDQSESSAVSNAAFRSRRARDVPAGADMAASENVNSTRRYFWTARETTCAPNGVRAFTKGRDDPRPRTHARSIVRRRTRSRREPTKGGRGARASAVRISPGADISSRARSSEREGVRDEEPPPIGRVGPPVRGRGGR